MDENPAREKALDFFFLEVDFDLLRFCCAGIGILNVKNVERGRSA